MSGIFIGMAVVAGFILGVRVGLTLGHKNERRRMEQRKREKAGRTA